MKLNMKIKKSINNRFQTPPLPHFSSEIQLTCQESKGCCVKLRQCRTRLRHRPKTDQRLIVDRPKIGEEKSPFDNPLDKYIQNYHNFKVISNFGAFGARTNETSLIESMLLTWIEAVTIIVLFVGNNR